MGKGQCARPCRAAPPFTLVPGSTSKASKTHPLSPWCLLSIGSSHSGALGDSLSTIPQSPATAMGSPTQQKCSPFTLEQEGETTLLRAATVIFSDAV